MAVLRLAVRVEGIVQGVGFRPFVHGLATTLGLSGSVANDARGVTIEIEGEAPSIERFLATLEHGAPPLATIERVSRREIPTTGVRGFAIESSAADGQRVALVSPDVATCDECLREIFDPADRRFQYAFTNCTNCGPRFTIVRDLPYDRATTTMAGFTMCDACAREYHDVRGRRFHAQPIACASCGPRLTLLDPEGRRVSDAPIPAAAALLRNGAIVAIKGLGGFHLAVDAANHAAMTRLRARKHRDEKPFAVMAGDLDGARALAVVDPAEARLLTDPRRAIVLLRRRDRAALSPAVAPANRYVGVMLPYTPVHHVLMRQLDAPIVLTSGNVSDAPIAYRDDDARERLGTIADAFLTHDRAIQIRTDDSVVRVVRGAPAILRRSRGHAPRPVSLAWDVGRPLLACGAELKNTICVARGRHAFVSHHIGDLEHYDAYRSFVEAIAHFQRLFDVQPEVIAHDLHPDYLSTKWALEQGGVELVGVQHHHAHIASCMADNDERDRVIGVAFDGLGYGVDGTLWGGEFMVADLDGFERCGSLVPVPMPGGAAAIREPWRMAAVHLAEVFGPNLPPLDVTRRHGRQWETILGLAAARAHAPLTSSAGRLFDACAALLGVRDRISYEGQAAIELEQLADPAETRTYAADLTAGDGGFAFRGSDLIRAAAEDLVVGRSPSSIAARFHNGVADMIAAGCRAARDRFGLDTVALSGGVFQNALLVERSVERLEALGFRVLLHRRVPPNDGGISLGQAVVAGQRVARGPAAL